MKMPALANAACREPKNRPLFDDISSRNIAQVKNICTACPDQPDCLAWGLAHENSGCWGGLSGKGLNAMREQLGIRFTELRSGEIGERRPPKVVQKESAAIRTWARGHGYQIPYRGPVPADIVEDWRIATEGAS